MGVSVAHLATSIEEARSELVTEMSQRRLLKVQASSKQSWHDPFKPTTTVRRKHARQIFDYFLVIDFEATCDEDVNPKPQVEFIKKISKFVP